MVANLHNLWCNHQINLYLYQVCCKIFAQVTLIWCHKWQMSFETRADVSASNSIQWFQHILGIAAKFSQPIGANVFISATKVINTALTTLYSSWSILWCHWKDSGSVGKKPHLVCFTKCPQTKIWPLLRFTSHCWRHHYTCLNNFD